MTTTRAEQAAIAKASALDPTIVELAGRGLALLDRCIPSGPVDAIARPDLVASQALVQARNTLRGAWLLLFDGFEVQALALARLITEYLVLSWYARSGNGPVEPWLRPEIQPPSTGDQLIALARDAAQLPELAPIVEASRRLLHRLAHQDSVAFAFAYRLEDDRPSFFRAAGRLDALALRRGGEFLLPLTLLALQSAMEGPSEEFETFEHAADAWWDADETVTSRG